MVILALRKRLNVIEIPVNYRGRVGESKITGSFYGRPAHRPADDRPHPEIPAPMTVTPRDAAAGLALAALVVCLAAVLPYLSTIDNYFVRDDFGVVELLCEQAGRLLSALVRVVVDGRDLGPRADEVRPFPAVSYQLTSLGGAAAPFLHHVLNIALHAANGLAGAGDRPAGRRG